MFEYLVVVVMDALNDSRDVVEVDEDCEDAKRWPRAGETSSASAHDLDPEVPGQTSRPP